MLEFLDKQHVFFNFFLGSTEFIKLCPTYGGRVCSAFLGPCKAIVSPNQHLKISQGL